MKPTASLMRHKVVLLAGYCSLLGGVLAFIPATSRTSHAADPAPSINPGRSEKVRAAYLHQMKTLSQQTEIEVQGRRVKPRLLPKPVFRYDDQPRRFVDATMWVWTLDGYPVAIQKVEAMFEGETENPTWGFCFSSTTPDLLSVRWDCGYRFSSKEPAPPLRPLTDAPAVVDRNAGRKRQARELARQFSVRIQLDPVNETTADMRLLTTPILEYAHPKDDTFLGAIYGFSSNGTNPDFLVRLEVTEQGGQSVWSFAPIRMTNGGLNVKYQNSEVWQAAYAHGAEAPFPTWTFFQTLRSLPKLPD